MDELFVFLSRAVEGAPLLAMFAAFVWGILSLVLSPCHLASIPLIVGFVDRQGAVSMRRAFVISSVFALGLLASIALIGVATALSGRLIGDVGSAANHFVATIFLLFGLHLLDAIPFSWTAPGQVELKCAGLVAALLLGLIFGIALGPCSFAFMAPLLAVSFGLGASDQAYGALLLLLYGLGHILVIVAAGTSTELVQRYLSWNDRSHGMDRLRKLCGMLVIAGGLWLVYTAR